MDQNLMTNEIIIKPIAFVKNSRTDTTDDNWSGIISEIELAEQIPTEAFDGIETFSHLHIIFHFHKSEKIVNGASHPRDNRDYPKIGIFAQRKKDRPNHLGLTIVKLIKHEGRVLTVSHLDAIDKTPIIDIKPVIKEFLPKEKTSQPGWSTDLMKNYW